MVIIYAESNFLHPARCILRQGQAASDVVLNEQGVLMDYRTGGAGCKRHNEVCLDGVMTVGNICF